MREIMNLDDTYTAVVDLKATRPKRRNQVTQYIIVLKEIYNKDNTTYIDHLHIPLSPSLVKLRTGDKIEFNAKRIMYLRTGYRNPVVQCYEHSNDYSLLVDDKSIKIIKEGLGN